MHIYAHARAGGTGSDAVSAGKIDDRSARFSLFLSRSIVIDKREIFLQKLLLRLNLHAALYYLRLLEKFRNSFSSKKKESISSVSEMSRIFAPIRHYFTTSFTLSKEK